MPWREVGGHPGEGVAGGGEALEDTLGGLGVEEGEKKAAQMRVTLAVSVWAWCTLMSAFWAPRRRT